MYIFTSLNTHFLPHVLGLSCFRIYFGNCAVNWSLLNVRLYCCEDWIGEFISPKFDKLFWLSETVCCQSLVLSVKVVEEGGGGEPGGGNNVQISTRLLTRGWCVMATGTRTRGLWTAAWEHRSALFWKDTETVCLHIYIDSFSESRGTQSVSVSLKLYIYIYYIHTYI